MVGAVLFLLAILLSSASSFNWKLSAPLKGNEAYSNITFQFNPQVGLTIEIEYDTSISLCIQEFVPVAAPSRWSPMGCTVYVSYGVPTTTSSTSENPTTGVATTGDATTGDATTGVATTGDDSTSDVTTGDGTSENPTTGDGTSENPTTGDATSENPTTGDATSENPTTGDATSENPTTGDATSENPTTGDATTGVTTSKKRVILDLSTLLSNTSSIIFLNRDILYYFGVISKIDQTVNITLQGAECNSSMVYSGSSCVEPIVVPAGVENTTVTLETGWNFFSFMVNENTGSVEFSLKNAGNLDFYLRYAAPPSSDFYDRKAEGVNSIEMHEDIYPGTWYAAVRAATGATADVMLTVMECEPDKTGPHCSLNVTAPGASKTTVGTVSVDVNMQVYKYYATVGNPLWVSVLSAIGGKNETPSVIVGRGYYPTSVNALGALLDCNRDTCNTNSIKLDNSTASANETWFIVVIRNPNSSQNETTFGLWFNSDCAPTCQIPNGECGTTPDSIGICQCTFDYTGRIDCSTLRPGLRAQYIVLIIIAALVLASAVIGFVAWAYMRRSSNKEGYQRVT